MILAALWVQRKFHIRQKGYQFASGTVEAFDMLSDLVTQTGIYLSDR
jgi:hypothetical protein